VYLSISLKPQFAKALASLPLSLFLGLSSPPSLNFNLYFSFAIQLYYSDIIQI